MAVTVKLIGALRHIAGKTEMIVDFEETLSVKRLLELMGQQIPELKRTFEDQELNDAKSNSLILVNGVEISVLKGYDTQLRDGDEVVFVPVIHGG